MPLKIGEFLNMKEFEDETEISDKTVQGGVECVEQLAAEALNGDEFTCETDNSTEDESAKVSNIHTSCSSGTQNVVDQNDMYVQSSTAEEQMFEANAAESSSESDWEEVEELPVVTTANDSSFEQQPEEQQLPQLSGKTLQITVEVADEKTKRKKKSFDKRDWFRQQLNRFKKETQENVHKVHLLCLLSRAQQLNSLCCDELLQATALSLLPTERISPTCWSTSTLSDYVFWFRHSIQIDQKLVKYNTDLTALLMSGMADHKVTSDLEQTLVFVLLSRAIGLSTRLVCSLQPVSFRPADIIRTTKCLSEMLSNQRDLTASSSAKTNVTEPCANSVSGTESTQQKDTTEKPMETAVQKMIQCSNSAERDLTASSNAKSDVTESRLNSDSGTELPEQKDAAEKLAEKTARKSVQCSNSAELNSLKRKFESPARLSSSSIRRNSGSQPCTSLSETSSETSPASPSDKLCSSSHSLPITISDNDADDDEDSCRMKYDDRTSDVAAGFNTTKRQCRQGVSYMELSSEDSSGAEDGSSHCNDDESTRSSLKKAGNSSKKKKDIGSVEAGDDWEKSLRQTSSASVVTSMEAVYQRSEIQRIKQFDPSFKPGNDWWAEVYLEKEQKWIYVNCVIPLVNQPDEAEVYATTPMSYVIALDNDNNVKDLTKKYAGHWLSCARKLRLSEEWWEEVLAPYRSLDSGRDEKENKHIHDQLMRKSLPATITEYKNHQLYALKRHLLKFEAIYPPNAPTFGVIRGEPIYARDCVYLLHTKDKWIIEGRCVKNGEKPYKVVQSRSSLIKNKRTNEEYKAELYGPWQTEAYQPERAVNGKIPVSEFGNVPVFKPWMVPIGTVHLPESRPGLNKVARALNIDCAAAIVAWDFHSGFNHPIQGGWIVCEEHKETLLAAWEKEVAEQHKKERAKKKQQVYVNWRNLIKGLLIRERIRSRFEDPGSSNPNPTTPSVTTSDVVTEGGSNQIDDTLSWPQNFTSSRISKNLPSVFPFEAI